MALAIFYFIGIAASVYFYHHKMYAPALVAGTALAAVYFWAMLHFARSLFGPGNFKIRMAYKRWVIDGILNGNRVMYTTAGLGVIPASTFLFLESPMNQEFTVNGKNENLMPEPFKPEVSQLQNRPGFVRLDAVTEGTSELHVSWGVSWNKPGTGLLLRRFTKGFNDLETVKKDVESLQKIAGV